MKRIALLTTWKEKCGIAHYSAFLKRGLDPHLDVTVIPLPRETMRDEMDHSKADAYIEEITPILSNFDVVNIQFEPSLFGIAISDVQRRFKTVLANSSDVIITFHSFNGADLPSLRSIVESIYYRSPARLFRYFANYYRATQWRRIYKVISNHAKTKRVTVIAHTKSDAKRLKRLIPGASVMDNSLSYMSEGYIANVDKFVSHSELPKLMPNVGDEVRFIGVFGFFAPHKGFETAILALNHLPVTHHLLMISGIHEASLKVGQGLDPYLNRLIQIVEKNKLSGRVHFIGSVSDDDLLLSMKLCDAAIMPYTNSGQTASGPANQAVELDRPSYFSRSLQFLEMEKYLPNAFSFFDIGNYVELAQKISRGPRGTDRMVGSLRFVDFPKIKRATTIDDTVRNYLAAADAPEHSNLIAPVAAE
jgi:glycosyltransferase involved in cell wall biosynthesis